MIGSYSMQKNIRKQLQALRLSQKQSQIVETFWRRHGGTSECSLSFIISACKLLLRILDIALTENQSKTSLYIFTGIRELIQKARNEDIFEIQAIKIKVFLLNLKHPELQGKTTPSLKKVALFLEALQMNPYFALLQEDFYSHLQLLYFEAAKLTLKGGHLMEALKYAKMSFGCIKRQLTTLFESRQSSKEEKLTKVIKKKGKTLQLLFYLQHGVRLVTSETTSEQITSTIFPVYQNLFEKVGLNFYPQQIIAKARAIAKTAYECVNQTQNCQRANFTKESNSDKDIPAIPHQQRRLSIKENICFQLAQSLKFVQHLRTSSKHSTGAQPQESRTSLDISPQDHPIKAHQKTRTIKQSRFSYPHLNKQSKPQNEVKVKETEVEKSGEQEKRQSREEKQGICHEQRFSMVIRAQQRSRERLKHLNPLRQSRSAAINHVSTSEMIKSGIVAFGRLN